uniref:Uncharacterized protein n=1 Tax=Anguilla anguilla TaxID=7936 RepID=A0A0E9RKL6_ANGAN
MYGCCSRYGQGFLLVYAMHKGSDRCGGWGLRVITSLMSSI